MRALLDVKSDRVKDRCICQMNLKVAAGYSAKSKEEVQ
jgi:hypothetical protein